MVNPTGAVMFQAAPGLCYADGISPGQWEIGSDVTFHSKPAMLDPIYGNHPVGRKLFVRIRPRKMDMSGIGSHPRNRNPGMDQKTP